MVLDDFQEEPLRSRVRMIVLMVLNDQGLWFEAHSTFTPALERPSYIETLHFKYLRSHFCRVSCKSVGSYNY